MLISTVPSAVGLHLLPTTGLNKATGAAEEIRTQNNESDPPLSSDHVSLSRQEQPFHLGYISPFKNHPPSVDEIKQKAQGIKKNSTSLKMKKKIIEKKTRLQSQESDWFLYRKGRACKRVASVKPATSPSKTVRELLVNNTP